MNQHSNEPQDMTQHPDPADKMPAEGGDDSAMNDNERGAGLPIDPADKTEPAEGGREEAEQ